MVFRGISRALTWLKERREYKRQVAEGEKLRAQMLQPGISQTRIADSIIRKLSLRKKLSPEELLFIKGSPSGKKAFQSKVDKRTLDYLELFVLGDKDYTKVKRLLSHLNNPLRKRTIVVSGLIGLTREERIFAYKEMSPKQIKKIFVFCFKEKNTNQDYAKIIKEIEDSFPSSIRSILST